LLKGPEVELPDGYGYIDKDGVPRRTARYAWWRQDAQTYINGAIIPEGTLGEDGQTHRVIPDTQMPDPLAGLYADEIPLFVGPLLAKRDYAASCTTRGVRRLQRR